MTSDFPAENLMACVMPCVMKHLIDFCKTMETSVDPCLSCYCYFGLLMDYCLKSRCLLELRAFRCMQP